MKKTLFIALVVHFFSVSGLSAAGFGVFFLSGISSEVDIDSHWTSKWDAYDKDYEFSYSGFGFVYDSNLSKESVVNHRLELQLFDDRKYEFNYEYEDSIVAMDISGFGFKLNGNLGYGLIRSKSLRLWVGLEVALGFYSGDGKTYFSRHPIGDPMTTRSSGSMNGYGVGAVLGLNYNLRGGATFPVKIIYSQNKWDCSCISGYYSSEALNGDIIETILAVSVGIMNRYKEDGVPPPTNPN